MHLPSPDCRPLPRPSAGFTIVELLAVMAVIIILAGILIPTIGGARNSALKAKTRVQFSQWATAIEGFRAEYGYYPAFAEDAKVNGGPPAEELNGQHLFHDILAGRRRDGSTLPVTTSPVPPPPSPPQFQNRKRISFLSFGQDEISPSGFLQDAFGNTEIAVLVDKNYDGMIDATQFTNVTVIPVAGGTGFSPPPEKIANNVRAGVIFFSAGAGKSSADVVTSW